MDFIETQAQLRAHYGNPSPDALRKQLPALDKHARAFIAKSPFVMIGSQDGSGRADVTPKGDVPGFVHVLDDRTIAIPDRPGNTRLDTWQNVIENPAVGLLFLIPGMQETLRINGTAKLTTDSALCTRLSRNDRPAKAVLLVRVQEVFMHCAMAFVRSSLWQPDSWPARTEMPTLGEIVRDQIGLNDRAEDIDRALDAFYRSEN